MDADGVDVQRDRGSVACDDARLGDHADGAFDDQREVVDDGAGTRARRQRAVRFVGAIGESFGRDRQARRAPGVQHR